LHAGTPITWVQPQFANLTAHEIDNSFEVEGLWEEIDKCNSFDGIAGADEGAQVPSKRGRIAGNVRDLRRAYLAEQRRHFGAEPGAWRVDDDETGPIDI